MKNESLPRPLISLFIFCLALAASGCGGTSGGSADPTPGPSATPTANGAALSLTPGDDTGSDDTKGTMKATCAATAGWEYYVEATSDADGSVVAGGACGADPLALNLESYVPHTISLYQKATGGSGRAAALSGDGWELLDRKTIPAALSECRAQSWSRTNQITCTDQRDETSYRICWSQSPFTSSADAGVTCADFTVAQGERIRYTHTGLTNGTRYYYVVLVLGSDGATASLPPASGPVQRTPHVPAPAGLTCPTGMVKFTGGTFTMGDDTDANGDNPEHTVTLSDFCIDAREVTQAQHQAWGADTTWAAYAFDADARCGGSRATCPAESVDWANAKAYCVAQGKRLPTEAEWEYAARNGGTAPVNAYATGSVAAPVECTDANFSNCNGGGATSAVGSYTASENGLYDMAGNVWEWTGDRYDASYYANGQVDPAGPGAGANRVARGGSWFTWFNGDAFLLRASYRGIGDPTLPGPFIGFRCASN